MPTKGKTEAMESLVQYSLLDVIFTGWRLQTVHYIKWTDSRRVGCVYTCGSSYAFFTCDNAGIVYLSFNSMMGGIDWSEVGGLTVYPVQILYYMHDII